MRTELGVNFSHIRAKSMTVLNPLRQIDEHIMDDADMAGPIIFCFSFATFLLLVSSVFYELSMADSTTNFILTFE
jgi:hypothetical protein